MPFARFEQLLKDTMGLDVASVGPGVVAHAIRERQQACGLKDASAYWTRVQESTAELQRFIETVVVPETWFFRDREAFAALSVIGRDQAVRLDQQRTLRLLSLPCATGEEPYSMAMALLDAGVPAHRFRVDAVDISARVVAHARRGLYRSNSFRGTDLDFRDRYFTASADGHQIVDTLLQQVQFHQANLCSADFLPGTGLYDVIFCRNMLIYFDREMQARTVGILARLLAPGGVVFVGASETGVFLNTDFVTARVPMAFAFRKEAPRPSASPTAAPRVSVPAPAFAAAPYLARGPRPGAPQKSQPSKPIPAVAPAATSPATLDAARQLADQGRFVDAALHCEEHLRQQGPTADAYYLLGLVRDASGNHTEGSRYYRKALYLDPTHGEALMHLALLLEDQGRPAEAQVLRRRMTRLALQSGASGG